MSNTVKIMGTLSPKPGFKFITAGCGITIEVYNGISLLGSTLTTVDANGRGTWELDIPQQSGTILYTAKAVAAGCAERGVYDDYTFSFNADSCNQTGLVCGINWSLSNHNFTAGIAGTQVLSATGIPAGCAVIFELFNGAAAVIPETFGAVVLTSVKTSETNSLTFPSFAIGVPYEYRPKLPLVGACAVCSITPLAEPFSIAAVGAPPAAGSCGAAINASCANNIITVTYANATGCAGKQITVVPSSGSVTPAFYNLPGTATGSTAFNISGLSVGATYQVFFDGVAVGPPLSACQTVQAACGGVLTVTAGSCGSTGAPPPPPAAPGGMCISLGTCTALTATENSAQIVVKNVPVGTIVTLEHSFDSGATWNVLNTTTSANATSQLLTAVTTTTACPAFTAASGVLINTGATSDRYRARVGGSVISSCA